MLLKPILEGMADVVGSRFDGNPTAFFVFWHSIGNKFLTMLSMPLPINLHGHGDMLQIISPGKLSTSS
ncbi:MAG: hypothetical protein R2788_12290 [Saprospiraceae bacterium]